MLPSRRSIRTSLSRAALLLGAACSGGRTQLPNGSSDGGGGGLPPLPPSCTLDAECGTSDACFTFACTAGECSVAPTACDDGDACTADSCDPVVGCVHRSLVVDQDGDGVPGAAPGLSPALREACGAIDCNDQDARVFPGAVERCDAVDNNCDGVVDEGRSYVPARRPPLRFSEPPEGIAHLGGLVATRQAFVASYGMREMGRARNLLSLIDGAGRPLYQAPIASVNADSYAGPVVFDGAVLATAWEDARQDGNYEVYFARFSADGEKLGPDVRVTDAQGFSLNPQLVRRGEQYVIVWDDRRAEALGGGDRARVYGQRLSADGALLGANQVLIRESGIAEFPDIASGPSAMGLVYVSSTGVPRLAFRLLTDELGVEAARADLVGENVQRPSVHWVGDRFVALFNTFRERDLPGSALWAAAFDASGALSLAPRPITFGAEFARSHDAVSLGDRLLVVWADNLHGNYEIYSQQFSPSLEPLSPRERLTDDPADSFSPSIALGPNGSVGVAFIDDRARRAAYITTLECQ